MSADAPSIELAGNFLEWQLIEDEKAKLADQSKALFKAMKDKGLNTKAARIAFREKRVELGASSDEIAKAEQAEVEVDLYRSALDRGLASRVGAGRAREGNGYAAAKLVETVAAGMQTEAGRKALVTALDIMIDQEDAETGEIHDNQEQPGTAQNEPEAAAEVAGDYLREPVAAEQGQIVREGDAPHEPDRDYSGGASRPDAEFHPPVTTREGHKGDPSPTLGERDLAEVGTGQKRAVLPQEPYTATNHQSVSPSSPDGSASTESAAGKVSELAQPSPPKQAEPIKAGEGASPSSPAILSDEEVVPAFMKDKPGCLKLRDGHCKISFATEALCAECADKRARAMA